MVINSDQNVSLGGNVQNYYNYDGSYYSHTYSSGGSTLASMTNLAINSGDFFNEKSDWASAVVIMYNRALDSDEITQVENYLKQKYFGQIKWPYEWIQPDQHHNLMLQPYTNEDINIIDAQFVQNQGRNLVQE